MLSAPAYACKDAYFGFTWASDVDLSSITMRLNCSKFRDLNYSNDPFFAWNNISSKIYISQYLYRAENTNLNDCPINIHQGDLTGTTIGLTRLYKKNIFGLVVETHDVSASGIVQTRITLESTLLNGAPVQAGKTITHEIGHALGLMHPSDNNCDASALMQQSRHNKSSLTITQHNKDCLIGKWGS